MNSIRFVNFKSDFDFLFTQRDCNGCFVPLPDFEAVFSTETSPRKYTVSRKGDKFVNCLENEDGAMFFIFNNHKLLPGLLRYDMHLYLPDERYPDGIRDIFKRNVTNIRLVNENVPCPSPMEVATIAPYIKGEDGKSLTYDDLTEEQKRDLVSHIDPELIGGCNMEEFTDEEIERIAQAVVDAELAGNGNENGNEPEMPGDVTGAEGESHSV